MKSANYIFDGTGMIVFEGANRIVFGKKILLTELGIQVHAELEVLAQEQANASDTVAINETQKNLFGEAKRVSNDDKNTRNSILMIVGVLCLVGFAMFLAFKNDDGEKKKTFTRTPKKDF